MSVWVLILVLLILVIVYAIKVQRRLIHMDELSANALSQIGVQLNSRWDALSALAELTRGYSEHEYRTIIDAVGRRSQSSSGCSVQHINRQEDMFEEAISRLLAVAENYPDLKASETYLQTMESVKEYENNVRMSRMVYNDVVTKMNRIVRQFPDSLFAGMFGFDVREYLSEPEGKRDMPRMI